VRFHLRVAVGVEQTRVFGRKDMRDAIGIPQDFGLLARDDSGAWAEAERKPAGDEGEYARWPRGEAERADGAIKEAILRTVVGAGKRKARSCRLLKLREALLMPSTARA
jgi:hypothetical protein